MRHPNLPNHSKAHLQPLLQSPGRLAWYEAYRRCI